VYENVKKNHFTNEYLRTSSNFKKKLYKGFYFTCYKLSFGIYLKLYELNYNKILCNIVIDKK